jgi:hypothetical protein
MFFFYVVVLCLAWYGMVLNQRQIVFCFVSSPDRTVSFRVILFVIFVLVF